ncbi:MAG: hypothetical protein OEM82_08285 [Acidobacteriota bacterium]|nr:hypothetical protein [Acidobacteriota bacterium]MDH3529157.1 hypothetical protein [Acidobacteriota bacterium]
MKNYFTGILIFVFAFTTAGAQVEDGNDTQKAEEVIEKAVAKLGGEKYRNVTTLSSSGKLSVLKESKIASFQSFVNVIIYPNKQRVDFNERGTRTVQVNTGDTGWILDEFFDNFGPQTDIQIAAFQLDLKTHYDYLLRGRWNGEAELSHAGRRQASLGKRNDVIKLEFEDDSWIEYEFSDEGLPMKTVYPVKNSDGVLINKEYRYAQFILMEGILFPFIVDHFSDGQRSFRVNYSKVQFNRVIPDSIFERPEDPKKIKKLKI